jgi:acetyl/propionyl-CoA carboxylase alpha subunit
VRDRDGRPSRFHECESPWLRSFALDDMKILVVCRGPVRKEAFDVFDEIGVREYGMLLSEKDSVIYPRCLAPELRSFRFPANVHRVRDYAGAGQEEKQERIREIVAIGVDHGYTHLFAGYGFMAEDAEFIAAIEAAGLGFVGPSSRVVRQAGAKDEAKKLARSLGNAVIPGVDDVSARALLRRAKGRKGLEALARERRLALAWEAAKSAEENAEALLQQGYAQSLELVTVAELQAEAREVCAEIWRDYPTHRVRFKYIGGGGGKGQRVVAKPEQVAAAVLDVIAESKVLPPGSNRNFLIELNIERTRHNEIQLIGNGDWCLSLGGRDCSVQMHEQKLLEVSLTRELLLAETERASGKAREILRGDQGTLARMEAEGERFGAATGLDSVSTFECVVEGFDHFFMEMNTRIQVEHGVSELAYALRFTNPADPREHFEVERLIEAMCLLARHGRRLPRPERVPRSLSGVEVRINATNAALQPHAGGLIKSWSPASAGESRFDQGIGIRNPDTGAFVWYNLAGAYDSNVALLLCDGASRLDSYQRMAEILRVTELRGDDLFTNLEVHYGLIQWFIGRGVMAEPSTRFMQAYLAALGALQQLLHDVDLELAFAEALRHTEPDARQLLAAKETLIQRPLRRLFASPHLLGGFLGRFDGELWRIEGGQVAFAANPVHFLERLHHFLDLEDRPGKPPSEKLWDHDQEVLQAALGFYAEVEARTGARDVATLDALFGGAANDDLCGGDRALWERCQAAHRGHQLGLELLLLIPRSGLRSGFLEVTVNEELQPVFPEKFSEASTQAALTRALAPPPPAAADEIVTPMGGTFYAREAPQLPALVDEGDHFEAGQPLFVIEVMKMFNKVLAPFSGTVVQNLMKGCDGTVVKKGQVIFRIEPDERPSVESPEAVAARRRATTLALIGASAAKPHLQ